MGKYLDKLTLVSNIKLNGTCVNHWLQIEGKWVGKWAGFNNNFNIIPLKQDSHSSPCS